MDHSDVARLQAVEKYVLGELPGEVRDEFEEHYFDCAECAKDVTHMTEFMTASRMVLEEAPRLREASQATSKKAGRFAWLRPVIAVPAMAALAAIVIFQNVVTIPALKQRGATDETTEVFSSSYRLQGATRGGSATTVTIDAKESFALDFDFTPTVAYPSYAGRIENATGGTVLLFAVRGEMANQEIHVAVPASKVPPGNYALIITGATGTPNGSAASAQEVQRIAFAVMYRR